jgi:molecular chaperone Hsp33
MSESSENSESNESNEVAAGLEVRTYFVRNRNALIARADFGELYVDYYLHQGQHGYHHDPAHDSMLKEALSALTLHCASRPWNETSAWTIHFSKLKLNLFVTGDNTRGSVVGQMFTEGVKEDGRNLFMADTLRVPGEPRRSVVELATTDIFKAVERYYEQSEQRPARLFRYDEEDFVMVSAHPDCDMAWFEALDEQAIRKLDEQESMSLLETRRYQWNCGCNERRMMQVLAPIMRQSPEELFGDEVSLRMSCPRCGARYAITREAMEAFVASATQ